MQSHNQDMAVSFPFWVNSDDNFSALHYENFMKKDLVIAVILTAMPTLTLEEKSSFLHAWGNWWILLCTLPLLVCELQFQFDMFDVHRKLLTTWKTNTASWREQTLKTPQQDDVKSCNVYVLKVGQHWPAISTEITVKFPFKMRKSLKVVTSR